MPRTAPEHITDKITRVARRFERTRDLGEVGGWFDKELQGMQLIGVAWFTTQVMISLSDDARSAFVWDLDAM